MLGAELGIACLLLHADELDGFHCQGGEVVAKRLGNDFLRPVQVHAGVHQIDRGLDGFRAADLLQNGSHGIRMSQGVLPVSMVSPAIKGSANARARTSALAWPGSISEVALIRSGVSSVSLGRHQKRCLRYRWSSFSFLLGLLHKTQACRQVRIPL